MHSLLLFIADPTGSFRLLVSHDNLRLPRSAQKSVRTRSVSSTSERLWLGHEDPDQHFRLVATGQIPPSAAAAIREKHASWRATQQRQCVVGVVKRSGNDQGFEVLS